jgi:hypothetical protein
VFQNLLSVETFGQAGVLYIYTSKLIVVKVGNCHEILFPSLPKSRDVLHTTLLTLNEIEILMHLEIISV